MSRVTLIAKHYSGGEVVFSYDDATPDRIHVRKTRFLGGSLPGNPVDWTEITERDYVGAEMVLELAMANVWMVERE